MFSDFKFNEDDPIERNQNAAVYKALRDGRVYALKIFRASEPKEEPPTHANTARANELAAWLEAVEQQKRVAAQGQRGYAPIYESGYTPDATGAWYTTDFYERGSLKRLIVRGNELRAADLERMTQRIVTALLDLKRLTGRSHGNLKAANVLRGGDTGQPLKHTPLFLTDLQPGTAADAEHFEKADLRALGMLVLQLVVMREVREDYSYPAELSVEWKKFGKRGEQLLERCNRLLDPQLSLGKESLKALQQQGADNGNGWAQRVRTAVALGWNKASSIATTCRSVYRSPGWRSKGAVAWAKTSGLLRQIGVAGWQTLRKSGRWCLNWPFRTLSLSQETWEKLQRISAIVGSVCLVGAGVYYGLNGGAKAIKHMKCRQAIRAAREALAATNLDLASGWLKRASTLDPKNPQTEELQIELETQRRLSDEPFNGKMYAARLAIAQGDYELARTNVTQALALRPNDPEAKELKVKVEKKLGDLEAQCRELVKLAQAAFDQEDYELARTNVTQALALRPNDPEAKELKVKVEKKLGDLEAQCRELVKAAQAAFDQKEYELARTNVTQALALRPNDPEAKELKVRVEKKLGDLEAQCRELVKVAQAAFGQKDYELARTNVTQALALRPNDPEAKELKVKVERKLGDLEAQCRELVKLAQAAFDQKDYELARTNVTQALALRPNDPEAEELKVKVEKKLGDVEVQCRELVKAAQAAFDQKHYELALTNVNKALALKSNNPDAKRLKAEIEGLWPNYVEHLRLARDNLRTRHYDEAKKHAEAALETVPNDQTAQDIKSQAFYEERCLEFETPVTNNNFAEIMRKQQYREQVDFRNKSAPFQISIKAARKELSKHRLDEARKHIDRALAIEPWEPEALALKKEIDAH